MTWLAWPTCTNAPVVISRCARRFEFAVLYVWSARFDCTIWLERSMSQSLRWCVNTSKLGRFIWHLCAAVAISSIRFDPATPCSPTAASDTLHRSEFCRMKPLRTWNGITRFCPSLERSKSVSEWPVSWETSSSCWWCTITENCSWTWRRLTSLTRVYSMPPLQLCSYSCPS